MANTSANVGVDFRNLMALDSTLWKVRMESTVYLQGCAEALEENKSAGMDDAT